jgi:hypothetical protein
MYRSKHIDNRTNEEKEMEECTFQPRIIRTSPFISERTLRKYTQLQKRLPPAPPPPLTQSSQQSSSFSASMSPIGKSPKLKLRATNDTSLGGMYTKANGLIRGPPQTVGTPMFYFDPFSPPNFANGTYGAATKTITTEEVVEAASDIRSPDGNKSASSKLIAPPLPSFVSGKASPKKPAEVKKIVITKGVKKEVKEEVSGWQAVLAEMERRKNGGMKKVVKEVKEEKKPEPKGGSGKKKKPKDFKDVMDELNYKLAVLRGGRWILEFSFLFV